MIVRSINRKRNKILKDFSRGLNSANPCEFKASHLPSRLVNMIACSMLRILQSVVDLNLFLVLGSFFCKPDSWSAMKTAEYSDIIYFSQVSIFTTLSETETAQKSTFNGYLVNNV
jgi:hypothetical protein